MVREHKKGIDRDEKTICIMGVSWKTKKKTKYDLSKKDKIKERI